MDIESIIQELRAERDRLEGIINALERLHGAEDAVATPKRRGRKFMDKQGRKEVSERMKRYWADRRTERDGKDKNPDGKTPTTEPGGTPDRPKPSAGTHVIAA